MHLIYEMPIWRIELIVRVCVWVCHCVWFMQCLVMVFGISDKFVWMLVHSYPCCCMPMRTKSTECWRKAFGKLGTRIWMRHWRKNNPMTSMYIHICTICTVSDSFDRVDFLFDNLKRCSIHKSTWDNYITNKCSGNNNNNNCGKKSGNNSNTYILCVHQIEVHKQQP